MDLSDKKIFGTLFFSIFATVTGVGIVVPLLPVYANSMGAGGLYIGLIIGAFSFSRTCFLPFFGRRSDRFGRKPYIVMGLFCYALISVAFTLAASVEWLIILRFFQGIASAMIMPVTQAYVGDITPESHEGMTMGLFNMSTFIGLSIGPLIGGVLHDRYSLDMAFLTMAALSGTGFVLSLMFLPPVQNERSSASGRIPKTWFKLLKDRYLDGIFIYRLVYAACIGTLWGFLPVYADVEFSLSSSMIGFVVTLGVFTSGVLQTPMGYLADRGNKRLMILLGGVIIVYSMVFFKQSESVWELSAANIMFGFGGSISMAPLMAVSVRKGAQTHSMGAVMALITTAHSLGMLLGSSLAGLAMDYFNLRDIFNFAAAVMLCGTGLFFVLTLPKRGDETKNPGS